MMSQENASLRLSTAFFGHARVMRLGLESMRLVATFQRLKDPQYKPFLEAFLQAFSPTLPAEEEESPEQSVCPKTSILNSPTPPLPYLKFWIRTNKVAPVSALPSCEGAVVCGGGYVSTREAKLKGSMRQKFWMAGHLYDLLIYTSSSTFERRHALALLCLWKFHLKQVWSMPEIGFPNMIQMFHYYTF